MKRSAEKLVRQLLIQRKWRETDLATRRKGEPIEVDMARTLRDNTIMTLEWIASRLRMGTRDHFKHLLYWGNRGKKPASQKARRAWRRK